LRRHKPFFTGPYFVPDSNNMPMESIPPLPCKVDSMSTSNTWRRVNFDRHQISTIWSLS
jgi:hypothetical protein